MVENDTSCEFIYLKENIISDIFYNKVQVLKITQLFLHSLCCEGSFHKVSCALSP